MANEIHAERHYHPTESKYKGDAKEMYVTYELEQATRNGKTAVYPKVKRVYVAGEVKDWAVGDFRKKSGRQAHGVWIAYEQDRAGHQRKGFTAERGGTTYTVRPAKVQATGQRLSQIVEVPEAARNIRFHPSGLPDHYRAALQAVR